VAGYLQHQQWAGNSPHAPDWRMKHWLTDVI